MNAETRHQVTVERIHSSLRDRAQLEVDALNGLGSIPGVSDVQIENVAGDQVQCSYVWQGTAPFDRTDEHLNGYGLRKVWASDGDV